MHPPDSRDPQSQVLHPMADTNLNHFCVMQIRAHGDSYTLIGYLIEDYHMRLYDLIGVKRFYLGRYQIQ